MHFEIEQVAELARLSLKPAEKAKLQKDLEKILAYVDELKKVNTEKVAPTSHVLDLENVHRPDEIRPSNVREQLLQHAPAREGNFFKVPKVIDQ